MGKLVYVGATSHVSGIIRTPDAHATHSPRLHSAWESMTAAIATADPDVIVLVGTDHHETFGLENYPTFCVGAAQSHDAWNEHGIPGETVAGDERVGIAILTSLLADGFDVSRSMEMNLDHGSMVPIQRLGIDRRRIVPFFINCNTPPLPSLERCRDLGIALRRAVEDLPSTLKVAVIATGGVSHWVGLPRTGEINEEWDHRFLDAMSAGDLDTIITMTDDEIAEEAGNGALEIRTWVTAAACAGALGGTVLAYAPMHAWVTGIGIVEFEVAA
jgi:aromatic ring-opening dioxygenase catalytic subunit (LigB family)